MDILDILKWGLPIYGIIAMIVGIRFYFYYRGTFQTWRQALIEVSVRGLLWFPRWLGSFLAPDDDLIETE